MNELSELLNRLKNLLSMILKTHKYFNDTWEDVLKQFNDWMSGLPKPISPLTRNLELLRIICDKFDNLSLKQNNAIIDLVLEGTAKPGDEISIPNSMGQINKYKIISRKISDQNGILYKLKNEKGKVMFREFFE